MTTRKLIPRPIDVLDDGAITRRNVGNGKLIPLVIIDTRQRADIVEMIRAHAHLGEGEVTTQWSKLPHEHVGLILNFTRPLQLPLAIRFSIRRRGGIVDQILATELLYLQSGNPGDKASTGSDEDRILIEVADSGFKASWEKLVRKSLFKEFKERGLSGKQAAEAVDTMLKHHRNFGQFRLP